MISKNALAGDALGKQIDQDVSRVLPVNWRRPSFTMFLDRLSNDFSHPKNENSEHENTNPDNPISTIDEANGSTELTSQPKTPITLVPIPIVTSEVAVDKSKDEERTVDASFENQSTSNLCKSQDSQETQQTQRVIEPRLQIPIHGKTPSSSRRISEITDNDEDYEDIDSDEEAAAADMMRLSNAIGIASPAREEEQEEAAREKRGKLKMHYGRRLAQRLKAAKGSRLSFVGSINGENGSRTNSEANYGEGRVISTVEDD